MCVYMYIYVYIYIYDIRRLFKVLPAKESIHVKVHVCLSTVWRRLHTYTNNMRSAHSVGMHAHT